MRNANKQLWGIIAILLLSGFLWFGCKKTTDSPPVDEELVDSLVTVANDSLAVLMNQVINETFDNTDSSFRPNDVDFTDLYDLYKTANSEDPNNNDTRFGISFCGLMSFLADPALNELYDNTKGDLDTSSFDLFGLNKITPRLNIGNGELPNGIPTRPKELGNFLPNIVALSFGPTFKTSSDSTISNLQDIIENSLMPILATARTHLDAISRSSSTYTFTITPAMQGNSGASPIIIDQSDFQVFLGVINGFEAILHIFVARNFDIGYQTAEDLESSLNKGSDFLKLRSGNHMPQAKIRLLAASTAFKTAIDRLIAEIGTNQSYDLIQVDAGDRADLEGVKNGILELESYFTGVTEIEIILETECYYEWNGYYDEWVCLEDTLLVNVDIRKIFDSPINDLKDLLPNYTITIEELTGIYQGQTETCFEWQANSVEEWTWPNPTFNNLFPDWTSDNIKDMLLSDNDVTWNKILCDTL